MKVLNKYILLIPALPFAIADDSSPSGTPLNNTTNTSISGSTSITQSNSGSNTVIPISSSTSETVLSVSTHIETPVKSTTTPATESTIAVATTSSSISSATTLSSVTTSATVLSNGTNNPNILTPECNNTRPVPAQQVPPDRVCYTNWISDYVRERGCFQTATPREGYIFSPGNSEFKHQRGLPGDLSYNTALRYCASLAPRRTKSILLFMTGEKDADGYCASTWNCQTSGSYAAAVQWVKATEDVRDLRVYDVHGYGSVEVTNEYCTDGKTAVLALAYTLKDGLAFRAWMWQGFDFGRNIVGWQKNTVGSYSATKCYSKFDFDTTCLRWPNDPTCLMPAFQGFDKAEYDCNNNWLCDWP